MYVAFNQKIARCISRCICEKSVELRSEYDGGAGTKTQPKKYVAPLDPDCFKPYLFQICLSL